jgi:hypothetical protein
MKSTEPNNSVERIDSSINDALIILPPQNSQQPLKGNPMNGTKQQYLTQIRANTAYPTYRGIIGIIAILGYLLAGLNALASLIGGFGTMGNSFLGGVGIIIFGAIVSGLIFLGARFWKEAALILADIGDSITETNSRNGQ